MIGFVRRGRRGTVALLVTAGALLVSTGCASIPVTSPPQVIPQSVPAAAPAGGDIRYDGIVPRPGESPEDIVRDFLKAGGSTERAHTRARAYLTPTASKHWNDNAGALIIENSFYVDTQQGDSVMKLSAQRHGRINDDGSYVSTEGAYSYPFHLTKVDGEWRIENPPQGLLIELSTFESAYRPYDVYFLNSGESKVVPDVRWYAAPADSLATLLVTALEHGPSKWLADAVTNDLTGVTLESNIVQERDRVKVYLTGLGDQQDTLPAGGFAQLVWTLSQLGVGAVEVYSDGQLIRPPNNPDLTLQQLKNWQGFAPDSLSVNASGYFIRDGAVWTTKDAPLAGPAGRSSFGAASVAASVDESSVAVVRRTAGGRVLYVGPPGLLRPTISGATLSRPTWGSGIREVWAVRDARDVMLVTVDGRSYPVEVPQGPQIGPIRALSLSRDGARVALVAGPSGRERLWIGVVVRDDGAQIQGLRPLDVGDTPVSDVSWSDAGTVIVLTRSGEQDSSLYSVDVDGGSPAVLVSTTGLPGPPTAVAAGPTLLTIAAGTLWRTPVASESWTKVEDRRGGESAPAYPG
jgi:lipoprotein LpqB-like beta-propeller protein/sporulation and spore germination protein